MIRAVAVATAAIALAGYSSSPFEKVAAAPTYKLQAIGGFSSPVWAGVAPGDRRIFVVEKGGRIRIRNQSAPFLDISSQVSTGSEQGLLSMAFANDWTRSHRFYVYYTDATGDSRVVEYSGSAYKANPATRRQVLFQRQPYANHNGGLLLMRPDNSMLIGFGDGGSSGDPNQYAQNLSTWLGKILRIDPRRGTSGQPYTIPIGNPFVHTSGAKHEIWISGVRNPWRFSIDPANSDLWVGDVGQNAWEEVTRLPTSRQPGVNLGWSRYEGESTYDSSHALVHAGSWLVKPTFVYGHGDGSCSVTGGIVYRGRALPGLVGRYLFTDICKPALRAYIPSSKTFFSPVANAGNQIVSIGRDADGEALLVNLGGGLTKLVAG